MTTSLLGTAKWLKCFMISPFLCIFPTETILFQLAVGSVSQYVLFPAARQILGWGEGHFSWESSTEGDF